MHRLIFIVIAITMLISGCDFVKKVNPFARKADTMELYQQRQDSIRRAELLRRQQEEARREQVRADSIRKAREAEAERLSALRYHLIVGAFKTPAYADEFQKKMLAQGHDSRIIMSENNFHLVTIKSLDNYREAVNEWKDIRNQGEHLVWLYIKEL
jgi:cell division protein FtsN